MNETIRYRLDAARILDPRSVAVIGASEDVGKFGGRVMYYMTKHGFAGRIVPVNKGRETVFGLPCVRHISEAEPVDVALLALPPEHLVQAVEDCAQAGVGACIVMTTGFAEAGAEGERKQAALVDIVRRTGMRLIGPNCMGLISPHYRLALTSSLVLEEGSLRAGKVGLISQSGALMVSMYNRADDAGIGFSACVSLGNQADMEICDFLEHLIGDPRTEVICIYMEGLRDPARFLALADKARLAGKPLLLVKTGRTEAGSRAAKSHTASLAGGYDVFSAACRDHGIVLLDDPDGMIQLADFLSRWPAPTGPGIGVISGSGGGAGIGVDRLSEAGLELAELGAATRARMATFLLPPQANNPIDLGGRTIDDPFECVRRSVAEMASDPSVSILLIVLTTVPFYEQTTREMAEAAIACGKPFLFIVTPGHAADAPRAVLKGLDCPYVDRFDDGIRLLRGLADYRAGLAAGRPAPDRPAGLPERSTIIPAGEGRSLMTEPEVKQLLDAYGISVTRERLAQDADAAVQAAVALGYPVALKAVARGLIHKSDIGGVRLGLADEVAVRRAFTDIAAAVAAHDPTLVFEGCLVQEMRRPEAELLLGIKRDPVFGPVVVAGAGGVLVELLRDIQIALVPFGIDKARDMIERLAIWPMLDGYRGHQKLDVDAAARALSMLSWLASDHGDRIIELDINPLGLGVVGQGAVALDARATLASIPEGA
ncbi:MAG: acetate--CoA ligase family protein [Rhizobiaceae bacterium]